MAGAAVAVDEVLLYEVLGYVEHLVGAFVHDDKVTSFNGVNGVLKVNLQLCVLKLEVLATHQLLADLVVRLLLQQFASHLLRHQFTGGVLEGNVVLGPHQLGAAEVLLQGVLDGDGLVKDVLLQHPQVVLVVLRLQPLVLLEQYVVREDGVNAVVHVVVVVDAVGDQVNGFKLVRVTRGQYDLVWVTLAVPLNL